MPEIEAASAKTPPELSGFLRDLFPEAGPELLRLYDGAAENADLLRTDFYTIRDLLDLSGYAPHEPLHALLLGLVVALDEGNLCIEVSEGGLRRRLTDLVGEAGAHAWAERILASLHDPGFPALIGQTVDAGKPVVLRQAGGKTFLYFQKYLKHELILGAELERRLRAPSGPERADVAAVLKDVLVDHPLQIDGRPVQLGRYQRLAVGLALLRDFVIVSGGPGTGKTSIVFTLLRCLARCGFAPERIALAAPTGRAAQRLSEAVQSGLDRLPSLAAGHPDASLRDIAGQTLHHLLGYHATRGTFRHHAENPLPADVVIVDEVSMVGVSLLAQVFQALPPGAKLILLGDKDQLPSVEAGAVLASLVPPDGKPSYTAALRSRVNDLWPDLELPVASAPQPLADVLVVLEENYRSQQAVQQAAQAVNAQRIAVVDELPKLALYPGESNGKGEEPAAVQRPASFAELEEKSGCWLLEPPADVSSWRWVLGQWAKQQYLCPPPGRASYHELVSLFTVAGSGEFTADETARLDRLFEMAGRARVLTLIREGPWGCADINRFLDQCLRPHLDRRSRGGLFAGALVLVTRNDYVRQLFNGDVGVTLRSRAGGYRVVFQRPGGHLAYPLEALPAHELGFALTVHKSQGSEYGRVLLVLPPEGGRRLLTREMVYTGITRARQWVVLCGSKEVIQFAISRKVERQSSLLAEGAPGAPGGIRNSECGMRN